MAQTKPKVTLIGTELANTGVEFIYEGQLPECEGCKVIKACNNLQAGKRYRIVGIRPARHACVVHLNGTCAVEVVESPVPALIAPEMAIKNTRIRYEYGCNRDECSSYTLCHPDGIVPGEKYVVTEVLGSAPDICERGRTLTLVELMPL
jgi:uncharacterized protein (UPF0179 family)